LFLSNVPIDANESNVRALFAEQLGGARVESVEFDSAVPAAPVVKRYRSGPTIKDVGNTKAGKKRKRDEEIVAEGVVEDEDSALPNIWPWELRRSGGCAVVVFVDRASCRGAWKSVRAAVKEGREVEWSGGDVVLGIDRKSNFLSLVEFAIITKVAKQISNNLIHRLHTAPCPQIPIESCPTIQHKRLPHTVYARRACSRPCPDSSTQYPRRGWFHNSRPRWPNWPSKVRRGTEETGGIRGAEKEERGQE
jgi:hypothetical protein